MCGLLELRRKEQRSRSNHLISRHRLWYWLEKGLLPSQITSLQCTENLAPAAKHFIVVFISDSVGWAGSVVSILGLRKRRNRSATEEVGVRPSHPHPRFYNQFIKETSIHFKNCLNSDIKPVNTWLLATCQHGYFHWPSLAWWYSGWFLLK